MTRRREIETRLALYDDLTGVIGAMRSFALAELHRVSQREAAEAQAMQAVGDAMRDLSPALPAAPKVKGDIWLLFGSTRGFCGSFNEDVQRAWGKASPDTPVIVVGERLASLMAKGSTVVEVEGATGTPEAVATVDRILSALDGIRGTEQWGLVAAMREEAEVKTHRLLPFAAAEHLSTNGLPFTHQPAPIVAQGVAQHCLYHSLLGLLLRAIRCENHMRLMQMETALSELEKKREDLGRQRNRVRQAEVVEEIELIAQKRAER